ncbi:ABC transporter substrate-binding protein [Haloimpatiens sp. FM7330]|uniref:ABC transporter substrate-binding protein n=1 Tax=Haloimpatiens sp. FM7330 TaxID=3298610 RepID=UPI00362BDE26
MKKICMSFLIAIITIFSITGCAKKQVSEEKKTISGTKTMKVAVMPSDASVPVIIAKNNGYFKQEGIDVDVKLFRSAKDRDSALHTNNMNGAIYDLLTATLSNDSGFNIKATSLTNGSFKMVGNVNSVKDLKDKSIGISKNTLIEYYTDKILEENNMTEKDVKKIEIPQIPVRLEMLKNKKIDAATLPDPLATLSIEQGAKLLSSSEELGLNIGVVIFNEDYIKKHEEEIKAFYRAYNKAVSYLEKEPTEKYVDVLIKELGFPKNIKDTIKLPKYTKAKIPSKKTVEDVIEWLSEKKLIKKSLKYSDVVEDKFVK